MQTESETIHMLKVENSRLQYLAQRDWLTGLLNRGAMEQSINNCLRSGKRGAIIVLDVDYFKHINDYYGHIMGDYILKHMGSVLQKMNRASSIIGRVGGDEFAIFFTGVLSPEDLEEKCIQIQNRFQEIIFPNGVQSKMSLTISWADSQGCRSYGELFDRADQKVMEKKRMRNLKRLKDGMRQEKVLPGLKQDMSLIVSELKETGVEEGAYYQDYESFKYLCCLELRRMKRKKAQVYLILFTLTDKNNDFLSLEKRDIEMALLGQEIKHKLRQGDVYTQYSSNQYLILVPDVMEEQAEMIANRIRDAYFRIHPEGTSNLMLHQSYPLQP